MLARQLGNRHMQGRSQGAGYYINNLLFNPEGLLNPGKGGTVIIPQNTNVYSDAAYTTLASIGGVVGCVSSGRINPVSGWLRTLGDGGNLVTGNVADPTTAWEAICIFYNTTALASSAAVRTLFSQGSATNAAGMALSCYLAGTTNVLTVAVSDGTTITAMGSDTLANLGFSNGICYLKVTMAAREVNIYRGTSLTDWTGVAGPLATERDVQAADKPVHAGGTGDGTLPAIGGAIQYLSLAASVGGAPYVKLDLRADSIAHGRGPIAGTGSAGETWTIGTAGAGLIDRHRWYCQETTANKPSLARIAGTPYLAINFSDGTDQLMCMPDVDHPLMNVFIYGSFESYSSLSSAGLLLTSLVNNLRANIGYGSYSSSMTDESVFFNCVMGGGNSAGVYMTATTAAGKRAFAFLWNGVKSRIMLDSVYQTTANTSTGEFTGTNYPRYLNKINFPPNVLYFMLSIGRPLVASELRRLNSWCRGRSG